MEVMDRTARIGWALALGVGLLAAWIAGGAPQATGSSSYSREGGGLATAWAYLEERSVTERFERPPTDLSPGGTFITAFPGRRFWSDTEALALVAWVEAGGALWIFDTGGSDGALWRALDLSRNRIRSQAPLNPLRWRGHLRHIDQVTPEGAWADREEMRLPVPEEGSVPATGWEVLATSEAGKAMVFSQARGEGSVHVVLGSPLANAWILEGGNARILDDLAPPILFDEWHQGYTAADIAEEGAPIRARASALLLHVVVAYGLVLWAVGARFGVPVVRSDPRRPTLDRELQTLGALHAASKHAVPAMERLRILASGEGLLEARDPDSSADPFGDEAALVALAQQVGRQQRGWKHG
jgi:hypothetical protein